MRFGGFDFAHVPFGQPVPTFPGHARNAPRRNANAARNSRSSCLRNLSAIFAAIAGTNSSIPRREASRYAIAASRRPVSSP